MAQLTITISVFIVPFIALVLGFHYLRCSGQRIREDFGIHSKKAFMNHETWEFANKCYSKLFLGASPCLAIFAGAIRYLFFGSTGKSMNKNGKIAIYTILGQVLVIAVIYKIVDFSLNKRFDGDGRRRKKYK